MPLDGTLLKNSILESLDAAQEIIRDRRCWTRGWLAKDHMGKNVDVIDKRAMQFCAKGALMHTSWNTGGFPYPIMTNVAIKMGYDGIASLNDTSNHARVMEMYDLTREVIVSKLLAQEELHCEQP